MAAARKAAASQSIPPSDFGFGYAILACNEDRAFQTREGAGHTGCYGPIPVRPARRPGTEFALFCRPALS